MLGTAYNARQGMIRKSFSSVMSHTFAHSIPHFQSFPNLCIYYFMVPPAKNTFLHPWLLCFYSSSKMQCKYPLPLEAFLTSSMPAGFGYPVSLFPHSLHERHRNIYHSMLQCSLSSTIL